jgi:hypothetical protein
MKTALITTTINVPRVLELYRAHSEDVRFFVTGDMKSDSVPLIRFCRELGNTVCYDAVDQDDLGYKCHELIGWSTIARRNIAMLEALKWGADVIVTIDDDNIPVDSGYFNDFVKHWYHPPGPGDRWHRTPVTQEHNADVVGCPYFNGIRVTSESGWFDVGTLLDPIAPHRGFPHDKASTPTYSHVCGRKVGVAAGICLGDPDISAVTRIARAPVVHRVSELLRAGIVVDPAGERRPERERVTDALGTVEIWRTVSRGTWTVFNSQNTAIIRELAPAFFMVPQWGRYDDIYGSLLVQRLMRERGYVTHFGQPFVWQQRNRHDLLRDLRAEQFGSERILDFAQWLDGFVFTGKEKVTDQMRVMFTNLPDWMPDRGKIQELVMAWCLDCDEVMK